MVLILKQGVVRGSKMEISIAFPDLEFRRIAVGLSTAEGLLNGGEFAWPDDFASSTPQDGSPILGKVSIDIEPTWPPFSDVVIKAGDTALEGGEDWHLSGLFAFSENQFEKHFFRHRNRIQDRETLIYSVKNILDHYTINVSHLCVVSVIYAYRAVDLGNVEDLRRSRIHITNLREQLRTVGNTGDARTDRDHLSLSLLMALWHVDLALNDHAGLFDTLDTAIEYSRGLTSPMTATSYNLSRMVLLRGWLLYQLGQADAAVALFDYNFDFYARSLQNIEKNLVRFVEQKETHHAVALSLSSMDKIKSGRKNLDREQVFEAVCRVRSPEGVQLLKKNFEALLKKIRKAPRV